MTEMTVEIADIEAFGTQMANRGNHQVLLDNAAKGARAIRGESVELTKHLLTTEELATLLRVKPQTVRAGLCKGGHYLGMRPAVKLPNRRLLWDAEQVALVFNG